MPLIIDEGLLTNHDSLNESPAHSHATALAPQPTSQEPTSTQNIDITTLFAQQQPSSPELRETDPTAQQLPSVDRLSELFSHALSLQRSR